MIDHNILLLNDMLATAVKMDWEAKYSELFGAHKYFLAFFLRLLLSHFAGESVEDVGGTERCCDNCILRARQAREAKPGNTPLDNKLDLSKELRILLESVKVWKKHILYSLPSKF